MEFVIRMFLLMLSFWGYLWWILGKIKEEFSLSVLFSGIGSLLFVAGILNVLQEVAWIIFAGGMYFLYHMVRSKSSIKKVLRPGILFFAFMAGFFFFLLFRSRFEHYDSFTHWGLVARILSKRDHFPNLADENLFHQSYPLGSACFIYYVTEIIGISPEWLYAWTQAVLITAMAVSLFAFCKKKLQILYTAASVLMLLCSNTNFTDLLVDTLLPFTAFAGLAFCIYYKNDIINKIWYVIPFVVFLISVKNSGLLFAVLILGYVLIHIRKEKACMLRWLYVAVCPMVVLFFWNKHVEQCFGSGQLAKHSMTISNFQKVFSQKAATDISTISNKFIAKVFSLSNPVLILIFLGVIIWVIARYWGNDKERNVREVLIIAMVFYVVYQIGMYGMYLFTMPGEEALRLAAYSRYHKSVLIFVAAILVVAAMMAVNGTERKGRFPMELLVGVLVVFALWTGLSPKVEYFHRQNLEGSERVAFDKLIEDYQIETGGNYLILLEKERNDSGYLNYMARYLLDSRDVDFATNSELETYTADIHKYDYLILLDKSDVGCAFMQDQFGSDEAVVCLKYLDE